MKQCTPPASQGNLFVIGFGLCQQIVSTRRLGQIVNMSAHRASLLRVSIPALGLFFRIIQVQIPAATLGPVFGLETRSNAMLLLWSHLLYVLESNFVLFEPYKRTFSYVYLCSGN